MPNMGIGDARRPTLMPLPGLRPARRRRNPGQPDGMKANRQNDRLGPAKELAQIGAVIGREFSHALLTAVARKPEAELQSALDHLITAGLLFRQGVPPHANYLFKHALVQDAAYSEPRH
jgi:predicted ATPase